MYSKFRIFWAHSFATLQHVYQVPDNFDRINVNHLKLKDFNKSSIFAENWQPLTTLWLLIKYMNFNSIVRQSNLQLCHIVQLKHLQQSGSGWAWTSNLLIINKTSPWLLIIQHHLSMLLALNTSWKPVLNYKILKNINMSWLRTSLQFCLQIFQKWNIKLKLYL